MQKQAMGNIFHRKSNEKEEEEHQVKEGDTCEICIEPITTPTQFFKNGTNCIHPFCIECIIKYIQVKIEDNSHQIPCPALNCPNFLNPLDCRHLIPPLLFDKWSDLLCESAVLGLDSCYCPNRECSSLIVNECGGRPVKRAACPNCKTEICFQCKTAWHAGYTCRRSREMKDEEDVAFGVLAEKNKWMSCPSCHRFVDRIDGCNAMICRCGMKFCYNCGKDAFRCRCGCTGMLVDEILAWIIVILTAVIWIPILIVVIFYKNIRRCIRGDAAN